MNKITLCLTIGRRPELLRQTLNSLLNHSVFTHIIAINDFRDEATNQVFRELCPQGQLISLNNQLGHHGAVDYMYKQVTTPYVMHCEDDWLFTDTFNIQKALVLLESDSQISQVCLRKVSDFHFDENDLKKIRTIHSKSGETYFRLDPLHSQWYGYTFNPHVASIGLWKELHGFSRFKKERHISRDLRADAMFSAYMNPGVCIHIGEMQSVSLSASNPTGTRLLRKNIKKFFTG